MAGRNGIRTPRGAKIRESATPAGVGDILVAQVPGSLRTPGYPLQRLRRTPGTAMDFKVAAPAVTTFTQDVPSRLLGPSGIWKLGTPPAAFGFSTVEPAADRW